MMNITTATLVNKYLSNSDIGTLLTNPLALGQTIKAFTGFFGWRVFSHSDTRT